MRKLFNIIFLLLLVLTIGSCASSRKAKKESAATTVSTANTTVSTANTTASNKTSNWNSGDAVTSKVDLTVSAKGKAISLDGTARMKRDDVIQVSLTYLFGIQVGTLEISKDGILLVDRINHQFVRATYKDIGFDSSIGFQAVQSLFWGEAKDGNLASFSWKKGNLVTLSQGRQLPSSVTLQYVTSKASFKADFQFSSQEINSDWNTRTEINTNKYSEVSFTELLQKIMSLVR